MSWPAAIPASRGRAAPREAAGSTWTCSSGSRAPGPPTSPIRCPASRSSTGAPSSPRWSTSALTSPHRSPTRPAGPASWTSARPRPSSASSASSGTSRRSPAHELDRLASWIGLYKRHRALLHTGRLTRVALPDGLLAHGVVARDRSEALFSYAQLDEIVPVPPRLRIPGLDPDRTYRASLVTPADPSVTWEVTGVQASGAALGALGLPGPARASQSAALVHLRAV